MGAASGDGGTAGHAVARDTSVVEAAAPLAPHGAVGIDQRSRLLIEQPRLADPTARVRTSYLSGEEDNCRRNGMSLAWLAEASADFDAYVAARVGVKMRFGVPSTMFWYVAGDDYLGTFVVRHELTPLLAEAGGHVGYHIVPIRQRQGHATRMLAAGLVECRRLGLARILLTCAADNEASRRTIVANGGQPDGQARGEDRFWIDL